MGVTTTTADHHHAQAITPVQPGTAARAVSAAEVKDLFKAVMEENIDKLKEHISAGGSLHVTNAKGQTLLDIATERDKLVAKRFLEEQLALLEQPQAVAVAAVAVEEAVPPTVATAPPQAEVTVAATAQPAEAVEANPMHRP